MLHYQWTSGQSATQFILKKGTHKHTQTHTHYTFYILLVETHLNWMFSPLQCICFVHCSLFLSCLFVYFNRQVQHGWMCYHCGESTLVKHTAKRTYKFFRKADNICQGIEPSFKTLRMPKGVGLKKIKGIP